MILVIENTFYTVLSLRMEIINHLKNKGYQIVVLSYGEKEDIAELNKRGFECISLPHLVSNPFSLFNYLYKLTIVLYKKKPKIVFTFTIRPNILGSIICALLDLPVVSNITGIGPLFESKSLVYRFARLLYKFAFKKNKAVFFQNEDDYNQFLKNKYVKAPNAILLPGSGVDTQYFSPIQYSPAQDTFSFLMISRLIKDKGVIEYLEASKQLKAKYPFVQFKLLGPFWTQSLNQNTITPEFLEHYTENKVIAYLGKTYDVRPFIADSNCIVLPSYREGNSNVLMQGGSMEKPLIATNVVGCSHLVQPNISGFLVPPKDIDALKNSMEKMLLLPDEKRKEMGQNARRFMQINFEKKIVLDAYEKIVL